MNHECQDVPKELKTLVLKQTVRLGHPKSLIPVLTDEQSSFIGDTCWRSDFHYLLLIGFIISYVYLIKVKRSFILFNNNYSNYNW